MIPRSALGSFVACRTLLATAAVFSLFPAFASIPAIALPPPQGQPTPQAADGVPRPLELSADGGPVCGLGADFHTGRRRALVAVLADEAEGGFVLLRGLPRQRAYLPFRQDKIVWYLTGIESPGIAVGIDVASGDEVLFLPPRDERLESWDGELWDVEDAWIEELAGFADRRPTAALDAWLEERVAAGGPAWISERPWVALAGATDAAAPFDQRRKTDPLDGRPSREGALRANLAARFPELAIRDFAGALDHLRLVKQPAELAAMRRSAELGAHAMREAMRSSGPGRGEWEIAALLEWTYRAAGSPGSAYAPIVGSGPNACVLHYQAVSRTLAAGELLLVDAGPEVDHFTTDITRTWPVEGAFSERAAAIYDAVLAANEAAIAAVRPGLTMGKINELANQVLLDHGFPRSMIKHGCCHWVGLEVHDAGGYHEPFVPGMAFTIEPGLYDVEAGIGVRIEDVVVVTADGCEVLTGSVPKDRAAVEALVRERGVLDLLAAED